MRCPLPLNRLLVLPIAIQICHKLNAVLCQVIGHHYRKGRNRTSSGRMGSLLMQTACFGGSRVIIPPKLHGKIISELHNAHPGVVTMKAPARAHVWWPGHCHTCQAHAKTPPQSPLAMWSWPSKPWTRLHVDNAGPFHGKLFLIVVDAHSKWIEALVVPSSSSAVTIEARHTQCLIGWMRERQWT